MRYRRLPAERNNGWIVNGPSIRNERAIFRFENLFAFFFVPYLFSTDSSDEIFRENDWEENLGEILIEL